MESQHGDGNPRSETGSKGRADKGDMLLARTPFAFYVLFDRVWNGSRTGERPTRTNFEFRCLVVDARRDREWRSLGAPYLAAREGDTYNMQLHPPVGSSTIQSWSTNSGTSTWRSSRPRLPLVLPKPGKKIAPEWVVAKLEIGPGYSARCKARPYVSRERPSRLEAGLDA